MSESEPSPQIVESLCLPRTGCPLRRPSEIARFNTPVAWIWDGYLARGYITLLTGQWKIGKSTLLAALLSRLDGGGEVAGRPVTPGRAVVITEEWEGPWSRRMVRYRMGETILFAFNPFNNKPRPEQWDDFIKDIQELHSELPFEVLVLDTLASVTPGQQESSAAAMTSLLRPLREIASASGVAILLVHHPRKGSWLAGQAARGTGVLPATADIILEFLWSGSPTKENRRRRLNAWSRHEATPREVLLELSADGSEYFVLAEQLPDDEATKTILEILRQTPDLTVDGIRQNWPAGVRMPKNRAMDLRLRRMKTLGVITCSGTGRSGSRFQYAVAA